MTRVCSPDTQDHPSFGMKALCMALIDCAWDKQKFIEED